MMAEEHNPDLIITDVMMPRMSGTEMCRRIKENLQTSHIPVILLTAWSTDEGRAEGYKVGADAYIAKPFDMDVLLARISNLLEKQEKRMHDFSHSASLDVKNIADSAPDEKFLKDFSKKLADHGAKLVVIWVVTKPEICHQRMIDRNSVRDTWKLEHWDEYVKTIDYSIPEALKKMSSCLDLMLFYNSSDEEYQKSMEMVISRLEDE